MSKAVCSSEKPGDFKYKACQPFCKPSADGKNPSCAFCKCQSCQYCGGDATIDLSIKSKAAAVAAPPSPAKQKSTKSKSAKPSTATTTATPTIDNSISSSSSSTQSNSIESLQSALHAAESRARNAEARLSAMEKQLSMCRHSSSQLRSQRGSGGSGGVDPTLSLLTPTGAGQLAPGPKLSWRSNATNPKQACDDAVHYAMSRLAPGSSSKSQQQLLYPGLNSSSTPFAVRLYLFQHDAASSRCADPRLALQTAAAQQHAADEAVASILLLFGVLFCGLLNAWSLGYLQPNRNVRRALSVLGCPLPELVR